MKPGNLIFVVFGASGDLTARKLIPAIYSLGAQKMLPDNYAVLGIARTQFRNEDFRSKMYEAIRSDNNTYNNTYSNTYNNTYNNTYYYTYNNTYNNTYNKTIGNNSGEETGVKDFLERVYYHSMDYSDGSQYVKLHSIIKDLCTRYSIHDNYIFYMATPPDLYETIAINLAKAGFGVQDKGFRRFIIEKPFGYDRESGRSLNTILHRHIGEDQIYRIDHFLGKETVQNMMVTRFANGIFEPLWNRNYIERVEITSAESIGMENRGGYYDSAGALRDMVQNHMLQMVGLAAMEPPSSMDPNAIRNEVLKVFQSLQPLKEEDVPGQVIRGQYTESVIRGEQVPGYRQEKKIPPDSRTETYVAMKFFINNWRWGGVPFFIRTGKRLPTRVTEVVICFKPTPHHLFRKDSGVLCGNQLVIRIQPDEGILLKFDMKEPGSGFNIKNVNMDFHYSKLTNVRLPSAYERLLNDVMLGDQTLFSRDDEVETAWKFLEPVLDAWKNDKSIRLYGYPAGTWGPEQADLLLGKGQSWRYPCRNLTEDSTFCEL